jgi:integrase/recombinase XerD
MLPIRESEMGILSKDEQQADRLRFNAVEPFDVVEDKQSNTIYVSDGDGEPILDIPRYVNGNYRSWNTKLRVTRELVKYFEYLKSLSLPIHYANATQVHLYGFRRWIKQSPEMRFVSTVTMYAEPSITSETWNHYQSSINGFYEKFVKVNFPTCAWNIRSNIKYTSYSSTGIETLIFSEQVKTISPLSRAISPKDFKLILKKCSNKRDRLIFDLMYQSGVRRGELFNIDIRQFKTVDRADPNFRMTIHDSYSHDHHKQTKTGGRIVKIPSSLAERISAYVDNAIDGRIVNADNLHYELPTALANKGGTKKGDPIKATTLSDCFKSAAKKAGFKDKTLHDLRHSFVTNAMSFGVSEKEIMDQAGHKNITTTYRYRTKGGSFSGNEMEKAQKHIEGILNSRD